MSKKNIIIALVVIILIIMGIVLNNKKQVETLPHDYNDKIIEEYNNQIIVDIKGEVNSPGIYYLKSNSRVIDAINLAGGTTPYADLDNINLATKLEDGMIVNIFKKEDAKEEKISINKATIDELMKLPGVGEAKAKSIVEYRTKNGNYMSLEEIKKVDGINENLYKQIKEFICL